MLNTKQLIVAFSIFTFGFLTPYIWKYVAKFMGWE